MHGPRAKPWRAPLTAEARERISAVVAPSPLRRFGELVSAEHATDTQRATAINAMLLLRRGDDDAWGKVLAARLDDGSLDGLVDLDGVSCRTRAVEVLLELGWPWALYVTPEDLQRVRARRSRLGELGALLGATAMGLALLWGRLG